MSHAAPSPAAALRRFAVLLLLLTPGLAFAAKHYAYSASHVTGRSAGHVRGVLTAYGEICDSGCKYKGENVAEFIRLSHGKGQDSWYTWTHVTNALRSAKYFSHVTITPRADGGFVFRTRQLEEKDKALVETLKQKSGKDHSPVFDTGVTTITVESAGEGKLKVTQAITMSATGMVTMFPGKIQEGMESGARITFANIER
jgi:hypothetical protein